MWSEHPNALVRLRESMRMCSRMHAGGSGHRTVRHCRRRTVHRRSSDHQKRYAISSSPHFLCVCATPECLVLYGPALRLHTVLFVGTSPADAVPYTLGTGRRERCPAVRNGIACPRTLAAKTWCEPVGSHVGTGMTPWGVTYITQGQHAH